MMMSLKNRSEMRTVLMITAMKWKLLTSMTISKNKSLLPILIQENRILMAKRRAVNDNIIDLNNN